MYGSCTTRVRQLSAAHCIGQVDVEAEDPMTGARELACSTFLTFVAFELGQPVKIAELVPGR